MGKRDESYATWHVKQVVTKTKWKPSRIQRSRRRHLKHSGLAPSVQPPSSHVLAMISLNSFVVSNGFTRKQSTPSNSSASGPCSSIFPMNMCHKMGLLSPLRGYSQPLHRRCPPPRCTPRRWSNPWSASHRTNPYVGGTPHHSSMAGRDHEDADLIWKTPLKFRMDRLYH